MFSSDQVIDIINSESDKLGFYFLEVNDRPNGYQVCAVADFVVAGHSVSIIFRKEVISVSRLYSREELAKMIEVISSIYNNLSTTIVGGAK